MLGSEALELPVTQFDPVRPAKPQVHHGLPGVFPQPCPALCGLLGFRPCTGTRKAGHSLKSITSVQFSAAWTRRLSTMNACPVPASPLASVVPPACHALFSTSSGPPSSTSLSTPVPGPCESFLTRCIAVDTLFDISFCSVFFCS